MWTISELQGTATTADEGEGEGLKLVSDDCNAEYVSVLKLLFISIVSYFKLQKLTCKLDHETWLTLHFCLFDIDVSDHERLLAAKRCEVI